MPTQPPESKGVLRQLLETTRLKSEQVYGVEDGLALGVDGWAGRSPKPIGCWRWLSVEVDRTQELMQRKNRYVSGPRRLRARAVT